MSVEPGERLRLEVGPVAHGGHCVARHDGQVVFVRHALPGEVVTATVTGSGGGGRFLRADAIEVHRPATGRVAPPCPFAGPGRCGGCDWQHADLPTQRELKAAVVAEQLQRLAGLEVSPLVCEPVPGDRDGLGWRTRMELSVDDRGRPGLRRHRSQEVELVDTCLIAHPDVLATGVLQQSFPGASGVDVIAPSTGDPVQVPLPPQPPVPSVTERVHDRDFTISARGFWQVHPGAAPTFVDVVRAGLAPRVGESLLDLYAGAGLFAACLAQDLGRSGRVLAVESDRDAAAAAGRHLRDVPHARVQRSRVDRAVRGMVRAGRHTDLVVLDPPRAGAGRAVMGDVARLAPRAVMYVACDPAALARDVGAAREHGMELTGLRVFDAFPMTAHMECLARLEPVGQTGPAGHGVRDLS